MFRRRRELERPPEIERGVEFPLLAPRMNPVLRDLGPLVA